MIRIRKSTKVPAILNGPDSRGGRATRQLMDDYDAGKRDFEFHSKIYGAASVKNALKADQHQKCAFCESKFAATSYGDVEHFRPKGGFTQHPDDLPVKPGYYWLAYDWQNLTFCCQICNQRFKKNHFPLANPTQRARDHHDDVNREEPLLINPVAEDPEEHIGFHKGKEVAFHRTEKGRHTINTFGLNRDTLQDARREHLSRVRALQTSAERLAGILGSLSGSDRAEIEGCLRELSKELQRDLSPDAEFSLMMKTAFG